MSEELPQRKAGRQLSPWDVFIPKCPKCRSRDAIKLGVYRRKWKKVKDRFGNEKYEIVEQEKRQCNVCDYCWWE